MRGKIFAMKTWPVPQSPFKIIPDSGAPGSFWEDRKDRRHAGIDIYAPQGSAVVAVEDGLVIEVQVFTSPDLIPYWYVTYSIMIQLADGRIQRYAELGDAVVEVGQQVKSGQEIGHVGVVLNHAKIGPESPGYIQKLKSNSVSAMLHFEMYTSKPDGSSKYLGGNFFTPEKPPNLLNPTDYLAQITERSEE